MCSSIERIKVAHVTTVDQSLRYLLLNQMRYLVSAGYEVVGISAQGPNVPYIAKAGIRHLSAPMERKITPLGDLAALRKLVAIMRRERFMIIHAHTPKAGLLGQIAARLAGVPIVVNTIHGFYFHDNTPPAERALYVSLEKIAARCSSAILSQNREDIATAIRERICAPGQISYLGNGIDLSQFDPGRFDARHRQRERRRLGIGDGALVVGFVGRLAATRKGFLDFLRAGALLRAAVENVFFLIVGEPDRDKADAVDPAAASEYGIADRCVFVGHRPSEELPGLYALMDLLLLPSLFEGLPRALLESCAMAIPIVASDVKGNREVVEHSWNGLLVPYGDSVALAGSAQALLADPERAHDMGQHGRRLALQHFDEQRVFERVLSVYTWLLLERGLAAPATEARACPAGQALTDERWLS